MMLRGLLLALAVGPSAALRGGGVVPRSSVALRATKSATLGLGCFWEPSEKLLETDGVRATACGYAGAEFPDARPSYASVCGGDGNVEAVRIDYDDAETSYECVLDAAFAAAKPSPGARQYAPVIFCADDAEAARASAWVAAGGARDDGLPRSAFAVETAKPFWRAESYHQEYWQRYRPRVAAVLVFVALQFGDTLDRAGDDACALAGGLIGLSFVLERVFGDGVEAGDASR